MMQEEQSETKRLFFGFEVHSPWMEEEPSGRLINTEARHVTLAFLGNIAWEPLKEQLGTLPLPPFSVGTVGILDKLLFLPRKRPHVVSYHLDFLDTEHPLLEYRTTFNAWLKQRRYQVDKRPYLPHVTVARSPFAFHEWKKTFSPLPAAITDLHLYESVGNLTYRPIWSYRVLPPFQEIEHTADAAYKIVGTSFPQLHLHAQMALAFRCPACLQLVTAASEVATLEEVIIQLNEMITQADIALGTGYKAVSFHKEVRHLDHNMMEWEMIVDV